MNRHILRGFSVRVRVAVVLKAAGRLCHPRHTQGTSTRTAGSIQSCIPAPSRSMLASKRASVSRCCIGGCHIYTHAQSLTAARPSELSWVECHGRVASAHPSAGTARYRYCRRVRALSGQGRPACCSSGSCRTSQPDEPAGSLRVVRAHRPRGGDKPQLQHAPRFAPQPRETSDRVRTRMHVLRVHA